MNLETLYPPNTVRPLLYVYFKAITHLNMYQNLLTKWWKNVLIIWQCVFLLPCSTHLIPDSRLHDSQGQRGNDFTVLLVHVLCFWGNREIITAVRALGAAGICQIIMHKQTNLQKRCAAKTLRPYQMAEKGTSDNTKYSLYIIGNLN